MNFNASININYSGLDGNVITPATCFFFVFLKRKTFLVMDNR